MLELDLKLNEYAEHVQIKPYSAFKTAGACQGLVYVCAPEMHGIASLWGWPSFNAWDCPAFAHREYTKRAMRGRWITAELGLSEAIEPTHTTIFYILIAFARQSVTIQCRVSGCIVNNPS